MIHGGYELQRGLNRLADLGARKGWYSQITWLTDSTARRARTVEFFSGSSADPVRLLRTWLASDPHTHEGRSRFVTRSDGRRVVVHEPYSPDRANVERIQRLYTKEHRASRVAWLRKHFASGADIEIHAAPEIVEQSGGQIASVVDVFVDVWDPIIDHWSAQDTAALLRDWEYIAAGLYPPGAYIYVQSLGFG